MTAPVSNRVPFPFHVMAKPAGPACNLDCRYCFYLEKAVLYPGAKFRMPNDVLEAFIRQQFEACPGPEVPFAWQGGEPTLMGIPFFEKVVALQRHHSGGRPFHNALQTNGTLLDDRWGHFLAEHGFLVGISVDGPEELHDRYRVDRGGEPTFARVMRGLSVLQKHGVEFNTLTVVHRHNALHPRRVYEFLRAAGSRFMQFIPIVERAAGEPAKWNVRPADWGTFLSGIFDAWIVADVGQIFVQLFDVALGNRMKAGPSLCVFAETCGRAVALEHQGDLYACDHFVYPEYRLGNLAQTPLSDLIASPALAAFGDAKREALPRQCRTCDVLELCRGECPKHRFATAADGEPGLSYLCEGYRHFFRRILPALDRMAALIRSGRPAADVMAGSRGRPNRNSPCPCGSGKRFKSCCGNVTVPR